MKLLLARHPDNVNSVFPLIIKEMLELNRAGKADAVTMMIRMLDDLYREGRESRYLKSMKNTPIKELKSRSRGGLKGGSRVYLFITEHNEAGIVNCEVKDGDSPSQQKLKTVLEVINAHKNGKPVLRNRRDE